MTCHPFHIIKSIMPPFKFNMLICKYLNIYIDAPRIVLFHGVVSKENSLTLICLVEGLQEFSYSLFSGEVEVKGAQNGKVIIPNYNLSNNITYKCISSNNFGYDTKSIECRDCCL